MLGQCERVAPGLSANVDDLNTISETEYYIGDRC
jgi:hypothetical protein